MKFESNSLVHVYFLGGASKVLVGRLAFKNRKIMFEYSPEFIKTGLELSPFKLPLQSGVHISNDPTFEGLFGVFNDSLPDGWGRLLLDRKLMKLGLYPGNLSPLDRLCFVGSNGMGALAYEPEHIREDLPSHISLNQIAEEIKDFQDNDSDQYVDDLLNLGGSSAGARPKILLKHKGDDWIIKFRSSIDPKDISSIEYAYHLMALSAKLDVPTARLFPSREGFGYFGVKRFDRTGKKVHVHTISGLLHADHRVPCLDYEAIMKATLLLTRDVRESEKQFKAAVFNVLSHNRDDHSKNFSFTMSENGTWLVSPAYDLTFSSGPSGEHCTMVMGEGKNPNLQNLLKLADIGGIKKNKALEAIDEVISAVSKWNLFADEAGVTQTSQKMIASLIEKSTRLNSPGS